MNDNEIIKALECCKTGDCIHCPKWKNEYISGECNDILHFALDLINRQKAEIERKDRILESYALQYGTATDKEVLLKQAKAEAIKEFAEKLKEKYSQADILCPRRIISITEKGLDNLVKEMVGEQG